MQLGRLAPSRLSASIGSRTLTELTFQLAIFIGVSPHPKHPGPATILFHLMLQVRIRRLIVSERWDMGERGDDQPRLIRSRALTWTVLALTLTTALLLIAPIWRATLRVGINNNEGWNALLAAQWMAGKPLYPAFDALSANNYPPLSFYAVGLLGRWLGDYLFAGRLLAFIGLFTAAVAVAAVVKGLTGRTRAALLSALLLLGYNASVNRRYVGIDDPQWLGHAIMLLGLLAFLASEKRRWLLLVSAGLMLVAGFVKHLLLPIPLAATLWLLLYRREVLALWLATCGVMLVSALALCFAANGWGFVEGVFRDARVWSLSSASLFSARWFASALPLLLLGAFALPSAWRSAEGRLLVYYALISAALAIYVLGGAGIDMNAIFDLEIALCLIIGLAIGEMENGRPGSVQPGSRISPYLSTAACWGIGLVLVPGLLLPLRLLEVRDLWRGSELVPDSVRVSRSVSTMLGSRADIARGKATVPHEVAEVIDLLAKQPGPVACETLSVCYWAGKAFEIDFFMVGQKITLGLMDPRVVTARLRTHYFAAIQTEAEDGRSFRLPPDINRELADNYEVVRSGSAGAVLVPRTP